MKHTSGSDSSMPLASSDKDSTDCEQLQATGHVSRHLRDAGLGHWAAAVEEWSCRFSGIERHADAHDITPARCVMRLVLRYRRRRVAPDDATVASDLARLPFTRWHARWPAWVTPNGCSERWCPMQEPFSSFLRRYVDQEALVVWEGTVPVVENATVVNYLRSLVDTAAPEK